MSLPQTPTVDVRAPNGGRIVLRPAIRLDRLPGLGRGPMAAVLALCAIFLVTSVNRLNHTDLWGHLNFGRWIVQQGRLPQADPFRPGLAAGEFLNVPWLGQVLGYAGYQVLGAEGLVLGHALLVTLTAAVTMLAVRGRGVSTGWAVAAAVASYLLALPITGTIRPQLFGMAAFAATLWAVGRLPARRDPLFWLVPLFLLWANLHGSFAMGLAVLGCHAAGVTWESLRGGGGWRAACTDRPVRRAWMAMGLATVASCVNPYGVKLLWSVAGFADHSNLEGISEWRRMTVDSLSGLLFFGSLLVTAVLLRWSPRRVWASEVLLVLLFGLANLTAIRMLVWWALVWPWVVAPHAAAAWLLYRRIEPLGAEERPVRQPPAAWRMMLAGACVFTTLWWAPPTHALLTGRGRGDQAVLSKDTPQHLADQLVAHRIGGRIYAPMDWADYLVWRTEGAVEPLVYSHVHLIGPDVWEDFRRLDSGGSEWLGIADRYELDYLVVSPARSPKLAAAVAGHPRCKVLVADRQGALVRILPSP
jgi:type IV secretory pathway VirB2 component (pilin)